jgi:hypothetical protein
VYVRIYRSDFDGWILEVADAFGNLTGWIEQFESDQKALDEFYRTLLEEGIRSLVGYCLKLRQYRWLDRAFAT